MKVSYSLFESDVVQISVKEILRLLFKGTLKEGALIMNRVFWH